MTYDGVEVKAGDKVWVLGSTGIHNTRVLPQVTEYEYFGPIEVAHSFSTEKAAQEYKNNLNK